MKKEPLFRCASMGLLLLCGTAVGQKKRSDYEVAKGIFTTTVLKTPRFVVFGDSIRNFIIGISEGSSETPNVVLDRIRLVNQNWQYEKTITAGDDNWERYLKDTAIIVTIDNKKYVHFLSEYGNRATRSSGLDFNLVDIGLNEIFTLNIEGETERDESINGDFTYSENMLEDNAIKEYLEGVTRNSKLVYKKRDEDYDIQSLKNFRNKFYIDNPNLSSIDNIKTKQFKTTFYSVNPEQYINSSFTKIENSEFRIFNYFKYGVVGYDKRKKKYFPIYFQTEVMDIKTVKFKDTDKILIMNPAPEVTIDLRRYLYIYH